MDCGLIVFYKKNLLAKEVIYSIKLCLILEAALKICNLKSKKHYKIENRYANLFNLHKLG
jgi:hypothetical protein